MLDEIKAHCFVLLRDSADRYLLWKRLSWFGLCQKEMIWSKCLPQGDDSYVENAMKTTCESQLFNLYTTLSFLL